MGLPLQIAMSIQITEPTISSAVRRCRTSGLEQTLTDSKVEGLTLRVSETGTASWILRYRIAGTRKNITIGKYPTWSIADAREKARALRRQVDEGIDVGAEKQRRKTERLKAQTVADVANHYFDIASRDVTAATLLARKTVYQKYIDGAYGRDPIGSVKPSDIALSLKAALAGGQTIPGKVASTWSLIFKCAVGMGLVGVDPSRDIDPTTIVGKVATRRDRTALTDDELPLFLRALDTIPRHHALSIRLLLLTGVRVAQLTEAKVDEFDLDAGLWRIPHERRKNRRHTNGPHELPLPDEAVSWVRELMTLADHEGNLFPIRRMQNNRKRDGSAGRKPLSEWLDRAWEESGKAWRRVTPHDMRSTCKTELAELRIDKEVRDCYVDHALRGMDAVYIKMKLAPELKVAANKLLAHYKRLETGETAKVIRIA